MLIYDFYGYQVTLAEFNGNFICLMIFKNNFQSFSPLEVYGNDYFFLEVYGNDFFFLHRHQFMYFIENSQGAVCYYLLFVSAFLLCTLSFMKRQAWREEESCLIRGELTLLERAAFYLCTQVNWCNNLIIELLLTFHVCLLHLILFYFFGMSRLMRI